MKRLLISIVIILVVLIGFYFLLRSGRENNEQNGVSIGEEQISMEQTGNGQAEDEVITPSIRVSNQAVGDFVIIDSLAMPKEGYVVIHEDQNGAPGPVIGGSALLEKGRQANLMINLDRELVADETLYAMLHEDDGDGVYEFPQSDSPIRDEQEKIVMESFEVSPQTVVENSGNVQIIQMEAGNFFYEPNQIVVKRGQPVKITFTVEGNHTFTVDELSINEPITTGTKTIEFTPDRIGVFVFYCTIGNHRAMGMEGTIVVEG